MPQKMYADRYSGNWAIWILTFWQFWAGEAAAKNFFDLPQVCYFLEQFSFDFMWKMNEKFDFLDTLVSALKSYTILRQEKIKFLLRSMPFGARIGYMPYFK